MKGREGKDRGMKGREGQKDEGKDRGMKGIKGQKG